MHGHAVILISLVTLSLGPFVATPAAAQPTPPSTIERPISLAITPGFVSGESDNGPGIAGTVTVELSRRIALEGSGAYIDRGTGADALALQASALLSLTNDAGRVWPYVAVGAGVYRASFDLGAPRFFGGQGAQVGPGASLCGGTGVCPYGGLPAFYGRRLGAVTMPAAGVDWATRTFTDPFMSTGFGVSLDLVPHWFLRPEARALFVIGDGHTQTLGSFSVAFGYRF